MQTYTNHTKRLDILMRPQIQIIESHSQFRNINTAATCSVRTECRLPINLLTTLYGRHTLYGMKANGIILGIPHTHVHVQSDTQTHTYTRRYRYVGQLLKLLRFNRPILMVLRWKPPILIDSEHTQN